MHMRTLLFHTSITHVAWFQNLWREIIFRELKHQNICVFHGCLLGDFYTALLFEHCTRGSLENILKSTDIQFDWIFKLSFALDAAQAMAFLHSKKILHGRLSTTTCMIDEEWILKIQGDWMEWWLIISASELPFYTFQYNRFSAFCMPFQHFSVFHKELHI